MATKREAPLNKGPNVNKIVTSLVNPPKKDPSREKTGVGRLMSYINRKGPLTIVVTIITKKMSLLARSSST